MIVLMQISLNDLKPSAELKLGRFRLFYRLKLFLLQVACIYFHPGSNYNIYFHNHVGLRFHFFEWGHEFWRYSQQAKLSKLTWFRRFTHNPAAYKFSKYCFQSLKSVWIIVIFYTAFLLQIFTILPHWTWLLVTILLLSFSRPVTVFCSGFSVYLACMRFCGIFLWDRKLSSSVSSVTERLFLPCLPLLGLSSGKDLGKMSKGQLSSCPSYSRPTLL